MFVPFHDDEIISQFEGYESYESYEELDWDAYRERYGNIQRLDRILRAGGMTRPLQAFQAGRCRDAVLLMRLLAISRTTTSGPRTARRSASSRSPESSPGSTRRARGSGSSWR